MSATRRIDAVWLLLVLLSVAGAGLGGQADGGFGVTVAVALVMGIKVRLVCDYFLELRSAHARIRLAVYSFGYGMPLVVILTTAFGDTLARLTGALLP